MFGTLQNPTPQSIWATAIEHDCNEKRVYIFRPHIKGGGKSKSVVRFFPNSAKSPLSFFDLTYIYLTILVTSNYNSQVTKTA